MGQRHQITTANLINEYELLVVFDENQEETLRVEALYQCSQQEHLKPAASAKDVHSPEVSNALEALANVMYLIQHAPTDLEHLEHCTEMTMGLLRLLRENARLEQALAKQ